MLLIIPIVALGIESGNDRVLRLINKGIRRDEAIAAMRDEVNREVERVARQQKEPVAAVQMRFEKDGTLGRIASHIQTEKTLNFLFEQARKTADA